MAEYKAVNLLVVRSGIEEIFQITCLDTFFVQKK